MKILEAKSWLDGHPQFQTESQWAYVMRMLTGYGAAVERAAEAAAIERCAELIDGINDSAGDRASYDNREMHEGEVERMNALSDAANAIRALLPKEES